MQTSDIGQYGRLVVLVSIILIIGAIMIVSDAVDCWLDRPMINISCPIMTFIYA